MPTCPACDGVRNSSSYLGRGCYKGFDFAYLACLQCGALFVDPMPSESVLDQMYGPDYLDAHYATELRGGVANREIGREMDDAVRLLAEYRPGASVLDVGCGAGRFLTTAQAAGLRPEGHERLAATADAVSQATGIKVHAGALSDMEGRYYAVHLGDVLEHSPRPLSLLLAVRRLLRPGGLVIARGPLENQANLFQQTVRLSRLLRASLRELPPISMPPYHLVLFTYAGWNALIRRGGLRAVHERVYELHWPVPERFILRPRSILKELSLVLSGTGLGCRFRMGNRVLSVLTANDFVPAPAPEVQVSLLPS